MDVSFLVLKKENRKRETKETCELSYTSFKDLSNERLVSNHKNEKKIMIKRKLKKKTRTNLLFIQANL